MVVNQHVQIKSYQQIWKVKSRKATPPKMVEVRDKLSRKKNSFQDKLFALTIRTETRLQRSVASCCKN